MLKKVPKRYNTIFTFSLCNLSDPHAQVIVVFNLKFDVGLHVYAYVWLVRLDLCVHVGQIDTNPGIGVQLDLPPMGESYTLRRTKNCVYACSRGQLYRCPESEINNYIYNYIILYKYITISDPGVLICVDESAMPILYPWGTYMYMHVYMYNGPGGINSPQGVCMQ